MKKAEILRIAVTIAALALLVESVRVLGPKAILVSVARVGWGFAVILVLAGAREAVRTLAWTRAVDRSESLRFLTAFRARLAGEALNTLLPMGMVVGEPTKASQVSEDIPFMPAFKALAVEFGFYTASLVLLFAGGSSAFALASGIALGIPATVLGLVAASAMIAYISRQTLRLSGSSPRQPGTIVACEIAYQILAVAETYYTLLLVSPERPTVGSAIVLETVSRAITMGFKMIPLRVGVDEASSSFIAGRVHLDPATGFALALVRKLRLLFWSAVGLALCVRRPTRVARPQGSVNRALARLALLVVLFAASSVSAHEVSSTITALVSTAGTNVPAVVMTGFQSIRPG
jgi:hypothetical protein